MGADLLITMAPMPLGPAEIQWKEAIEEWNKHYHKVLDSISAEDLLAIHDDRYGDVPGVPDEDLPERALIQVQAGEAKKKFAEIIDEYLSWDVTGYRDCDWYYVNGGWVLITGGMSWGDDPSDSFSDVGVLTAISWHERHLDK